MQKPLPDFSAPEWTRMSERGKFHVIREFVLNHEGPIDQQDVCRILTQVCKISVGMIDDVTRTFGRENPLDHTRLLNEQIGMYGRPST